MVAIAAGTSELVLQWLAVSGGFGDGSMLREILPDEAGARGGLRPKYSPPRKVTATPARSHMQPSSTCSSWFASFRWPQTPRIRISHHITHHPPSQQW